MKTAIYIEDGVTQLVITPESEWEKSALKSMKCDQGIEAKIFRGTFYDCAGGWIRQTAIKHGSNAYTTGDHEDESLMIKCITPKGEISSE